MNIETRKFLDKSFVVAAYGSLCLMCVSIVVFLAPIIYGGLGAVIFKASVEHEKFLYENLNTASFTYTDYLEKSDKARKVLYTMMADFENSKSQKNYEDKLSDAKNEAFKQIEISKAEILKCAQISNAEEKTKKLYTISNNVWKPLFEELSRFSKYNENSLVLEKSLRDFQENLPEELKENLAQITDGSKLTLSQKLSLRRNFLDSADTEISKVLQEFELKNAAYLKLKKGFRELLGPATLAEKEAANLLRQKYGQTRENLALDVLKNSILKIDIHKISESGAEESVKVNSLDYFKSGPVSDMILYTQKNLDDLMQFHWTIYLGFFFDSPYDSNIFGGIWPMILGTFYLTLGSLIIATPLGVIAAIYFSEYAKEGKLISILRMCVGTLAGVPSIVFGLFGLAFLINTLKISESKSVLAGSITLALLILPTIIRSCEEALKSVPNSYREASLGLGATKWKSICSVILPAALPSMLTGIIISMGRAAGETAPIIFTAATSTGAALAVWEIFTQPSPALPWNIYNICSEHEMADKIMHVQYGMALTLILIVLSLNFVAILIRAKLQKNRI